MPLPYDATGKTDNSWLTSDNSVSRIMGFSFLASFFQADAESMGQGTSYLMSSMRLFLLGTIIEGGRRLFGWTMDRFRPFQYSISAHFSEGDPAHDWITLFLTEEKIWNRSRKFHVNSRSSVRQWTVDLNSKSVDGHADEHTEFVPMYDAPQLFWWKGYWTEVRKGGKANRSSGTPGYPFVGEDPTTGELSLTIYTRNIGAMSALVEEARQRYVKTSRPHVIVHTAIQGRGFNAASIWGTAKRKARRPLSSIILQDGVIKSLVGDVQDFYKSEGWYAKAGIPHRRGYLLHGPPGTGKSSTIYAVAGALGMEIYSLSLSSEFVDDAFLERAVSAIPKHSILLIEDIDCAFPSREDGEEEDTSGMGIPGMVTTVMRRGIRLTPRAQITLSGLLNVLDGVGSEEGRIFFATTNYIERLDPAFLRPGRIDKKLQYKLATQAQAAALFMRFYPEYPDPSSEGDAEKIAPLSTVDPEKWDQQVKHLSERFSESVPPHEFSTAELQGFLLSCKHEPIRAVEEVGAWVQEELVTRQERLKKEAERKEKTKSNKKAREEQLDHGERMGRRGRIPEPNNVAAVAPKPSEDDGIERAPDVSSSDSVPTSTSIINSLQAAPPAISAS